MKPPNSFYISLLLLVFALWPLLAMAEELQALEALIEYALQHNPDWKATQLQENYAQEGMDGAAGWKDPKLQITQFGESIETRQGPQERVIRVSQELPFWGETEWAQKSAQASLNLAQKQAHSKKWQLIASVKQTYFRLWELQGSIQLLQETQKVVKEMTSLVGADATEYMDVLKNTFTTNAQLAQSTHDLLKAQEQFTMVQSQMITLLGGTKVSLELIDPPHMPSFHHNLDTLLELAFQSNPAWLKWNDQVSQIQAQKSAAQAKQWHPNVELGVNYFEIGEAANSNTSKSGQDAYSFTIGVNLPFGSKNKAQAAQLQIKEQQVQMQQQHQSNLLKEKITELYYQVTNAQRLYQLYQGELLPQALNSQSASQSLYRSGKAQIKDVLEMERVILQLKLKTLNAQSQYLQFLAELESWTGKGF